MEPNSCLLTSVRRKPHSLWAFLSKVRAAGIRAEIFPDAAKMKKQMSYANAKNIPFVATSVKTK